MTKQKIFHRGLTTGLIVTVATFSAIALRADDDQKQGTALTEQGRASAKVMNASMFIKEAAQGNACEVALADIAAQKTQNSELKTFAEHIRKDHAAANEKLQPIAEKNGVAWSDKLDARHQAQVDKLQKLSGAEFDKQYATEMLKDHQKDIQKFQSASQQLQQADVKEYATTTLPTLREHFAEAQKTAKAVGVDEETISSYSKEIPEAVGGTEDQDKIDTGTSKQKNNQDLDQKGQKNDLQSKPD